MLPSKCAFKINVRRYTKRSIEVLMFTSEEPTRFGLSSVGARAMASKLDPAYLASLTDILVGRCRLTLSNLR